MKQRTRGFTSILIAVGIVAAFALGAFVYAKLHPQELTGGASVTDTQLSDTLGTFRTNVNSSLDSINSELETVSGTVKGFGNITSQSIPLAVNAGGIGTTTLPANAQFLSASGTSPAWKTLIFGGGLITTTTATSVSLNTTGFDPTANYAFSGNNTHSGSETFSSTTALNGPTTLNANLTQTSGTTSLASTTITGQLSLVGSVSSTASFVSEKDGTVTGFTISTTSNATINMSSTITLGFQPKVIGFSAGFACQGTGSGSATQNVAGSALVNASDTAIGGFSTLDAANSAGGGQRVITSASSLVGSIGCADLGGTGRTITMTLAVVNITSTGFTVSATSTLGGGGGSSVTANYNTITWYAIK